MGVGGQDAVGTEMDCRCNDQRVRESQSSAMLGAELGSATCDLARDGLDFRGAISEECVQLPHQLFALAGRRHLRLGICRCRNRQRITSVERSRQRVAGSLVMRVSRIQDADDDTGIQHR
jgi:hypothetical protein